MNHFGFWQGGELDTKFREKADKHEVYSLIRRLDNLEHSLREARSEVASLQYRVQELLARQIVNSD